MIDSKVHCSASHRDERSVGNNSFVCCGAIAPSSSLYNSRACGKGTIITSSTLHDSIACCGAVVRSSTATGSRFCGSRHDSHGKHIGDETDICEVRSSTVTKCKVGLGLISSSTVTSSTLGECTIKSSTVASCIMFDILRTSDSTGGDRSGKGRFDFSPHYVPSKKGRHDGGHGGHGDHDHCVKNIQDEDMAPPYSLTANEKTPLITEEQFATDTTPSRCCVIA
ncbi:hypothetical protein BCR39DRAFT_210537 [Naematelia encephala]|uniref:Uncharacterized protein n=1 Tax=Naematelia encephala TaxID=71784 RepID=A0A1Y2B0C0_9TREE|nr:hypothetical protein BCR39DRAFT_210537 [Naematelia encephala]